MLCMKCDGRRYFSITTDLVRRGNGFPLENLFVSYIVRSETEVRLWSQPSAATGDDPIIRIIGVIEVSRVIQMIVY
jgi:hypothetical protein